ncbi:DUF2800 domain-containing protein [Aquariibacter albus]|uniref:DUF2800 domain-containing protein n=1 Tax=Aquariibacter albus TaxID=2759899 RepID=A0A839HQC2_9BURK|nr:DUF2800 domain-containing protein [Aquariibacter albus]MBB1161499.1 DUF2800 domain-containing protein [Aquariibacter albus]
MSHALLSPSAAHRWMACPGSVLLTRDLPDESNTFADEGTAAHELAATCLLMGVDAAEYIGEQVNVSDRAIFTVGADMAAYAQVYLDTVRALVAAGGELMVEQRLSIEHLTGEPGAHGTADAVVVLGSELIVIDLKYGRGVEVDAKHNEQLQIYALAALRELELAHELTHARLIIVQPRRNHIDEWTVGLDELRTFGQAVDLKAGWVRGCLSQGLDEVEDLHPTEHGCRFCRAKASCPALRQRVLDTVADDFVDVSQPLAPQLAGALDRIEQSDSAHLGACLAAVELVETWCKAVRARAEGELLAGRQVPGFKLVEGRKGARKWESQDEAETALEVMGLKHSLRYEYALITPTTAEKLAKAGEIGPKQWTKLKALIVTPPGKPSVAPASDKRPALDPGAALDDFEVVTPPAEAIA